MKKRQKEIALFIKAKFEKGQVVKVRGFDKLYVICHRLVDIDSKVLSYRCQSEANYWTFLETELVAAVKKVNAIGETYFE